jgi:hypothetical protein
MTGLELLVGYAIYKACTRKSAAAELEEDRKDREKTLMRNLRKSEREQAREEKRQEREAIRKLERDARWIEEAKKTRVWDEKAHRWWKIDGTQYWHAGYLENIPLAEGAVWDEQLGCWYVDLSDEQRNELRAKWERNPARFYGCR